MTSPSGHLLREELRALVSLSDPNVRIESSDLLQVILTDWLRVCVQISHAFYPSNPPLCFVEVDSVTVEDSVVKAVIAHTEKLSWDATSRTPLHSYIQQLISGLCELRAVAAPTLPPVDTESTPAAEFVSDCECESESETDHLGMDCLLETSACAAGHSLLRAGNGDSPGERPEECADATKRGKVDDYSIFQRFGKAQPRPGAEAGFGKTVTSTVHATDRLMKELKAISLLDTHKEGFSAQPVGDSLYEWDIVLFDIQVDTACARPSRREPPAPRPADPPPPLPPLPPLLPPPLLELAAAEAGAQEEPDAEGEPPGPASPGKAAPHRKQPVAAAAAAAAVAAAAAAKAAAPGEEESAEAADNGLVTLPPVHLRFKFGADFPHTPPFVRVVRPRLKGSFVFPHGALCMELLTSDGWSPANSVESVVHQIRAMIIQGAAVVDTSATAKLGDTTELMAQKEFQAIVDTHKKPGWSSLKRWRS